MRLGITPEDEGFWRLALHETRKPVDPRALGWSLRTLGSIYAAREQWVEAEQALRRSLELLEPVLGANDPIVLDTRRIYDLVLRDQQLREPGRTGG